MTPELRGLRMSTCANPCHSVIVEGLTVYHVRSLRRQGSM